MELVIAALGSALINFKRDPSERNNTALGAARNKAQQTARHCANNYWLQLCQSIQTSSDTGNIRGMYDGIKKATGPTMKKTSSSSSFGFFPSGVATADFPYPVTVAPIFYILLRHFNLSHVHFRHRGVPS